MSEDEAQPFIDVLQAELGLAYVLTYHDIKRDVPDAPDNALCIKILHGRILKYAVNVSTADRRKLPACVADAAQQIRKALGN